MIRHAGEDYLRLRRSLGFKLEVPGRLVLDFTSFLDAAEAAHITAELALAWAVLPTGAQPSWYYYRLNAIRGFAKHMHAIDPRHQVPPADLLPRRVSRPVPYLFTSGEAAALMRAAETTLRPPLHAATYKTFIGLLEVTRHAARRGDRVSPRRRRPGRRPAYRAGKYGKTRQLALHPSTVTALSRYAALRDQLCPRPAASSFFVSTVGSPLLPAGVTRTFRTLARRVGLQPRSERRRPQPIGLRHSFAVNTLIDWYRAGVDVNTRLPLLSTWMGHAAPASTYWYLQAVPELLALAAQRQQHATRRLP
jgi:integrase